MSSIITLLVGLIVGAVAKLLMPGKELGGISITMLLGAAGAVIAGFLGHSLGRYEPGEAPGIIASIIGALVVLVGYRAILDRRA